MNIVLPSIISGGNLNVQSQQGSVFLGETLNVVGETRITAQGDISFSDTSVFLPDSNVFLTAGNDINFAASSDLNDPGFLGLDSSNPASFIFNAGRTIAVVSGLWLGTGDFIASAGTAEQL